MTADREVDRRVAKEVMGWSIIEEGDDGDSSRDRFTNDAGEFGTRYCLTDIGARYHGEERHSVWEPSSNIAHAMEVAEYLRSLGWLMSMTYMRDGSIVVHLTHDSDGIVLGKGDRPAMAICVAALKAASKGP